MGSAQWSVMTICLWDGYESGPACGRATGYTERDATRVNCLACLRLRVKYLEDQLRSHLPTQAHPNINTPHATLSNGDIVMPMPRHKKET